MGNGFNGLGRALPGDGALLSPSSSGYGVPKPGRADLPPLDLTPASRRQDHTTSPSATTSLVSAPLIAHRPFDPPCHHVARLGAAASTASHPASVTIAIRPLCPESLAECTNGRLPTNRPLLELSPLRPRGDRACLRARDSSGVFLNPNSCKGFEPVPNKEGSG